MNRRWSGRLQMASLRSDVRPRALGSDLSRRRGTRAQRPRTGRLVGERVAFARCPRSGSVAGEGSPAFSGGRLECAHRWRTPNKNRFRGAEEADEEALGAAPGAGASRLPRRLQRGRAPVPVRTAGSHAVSSASHGAFGGRWGRAARLVCGCRKLRRGSHGRRGGRVEAATRRSSTVRRPADPSLRGASRATKAFTAAPPYGFFVAGVPPVRPPAPGGDDSRAAGDVGATRPPPAWVDPSRRRAFLPSRPATGRRGDRLRARRGYVPDRPAVNSPRLGARRSRPILPTFRTTARRMPWRRALARDYEPAVFEPLEQPKEEERCG